jgi:hypothetical protein
LTGRLVYGGNGIEPDEVVKAPRYTSFQLSLLDPLFFFSTDLVSGRIPALTEYKRTTGIRYGHRIKPSDLPPTDKLFAAFKQYISSGEYSSFKADKLDEQRNFIVERLRNLVATAYFGSVAAEQVLVENDQQVAKAVEALPRAQTLAQSARKLINKQ